MIKTPLSIAIGGVGFYTKNAVVIGGHKSEPEPPFNIASLFSNGEQGLFYDPHTLDNSLLGQTVPTVPDLSGNAINASNANSAQQMLLEVDEATGYKYLEADGVDDFYATPVFALPKPFTVIMAFESTKPTGTQALFSGGASGYLLTSSLTNVGLQQNSGNPSFYQVKNTKDVVTHCADVNGVLLKTNIGANLKKDIVHDNPFSATGQKFIANFSGASSTTLAGIKLYAMLVINRVLTDEEEAAVRKEFNKRMGIV